LKIFSLAQICKDKLRSLHSSNLAPKSPRDKEADLVRMDEETKLKRTKDISSDESLKRSLYEEKEVKLESSGEELGKEEEVKYDIFD
jgi:flagellar biosynthesis GTPase FlhF